MLVLLVARTLLAGLTVTVPAEGRIRGLEVELGELCAIEGTDPLLVERARALPLGFAPGPGFSRLVTRARIESELARAFPGFQIQVTGERACQVVAELDELTPAALEAAARRELERAFQGVPATFLLAAPIEPLSVPRGHEATVMRAIVSPVPRAGGPLGVALEILVDGQCYRTAWTSWRVDVWEVRPTLAPRPSLLFARGPADERPVAERADG
jgi:hypothetical protein